MIETERGIQYRSELARELRHLKPALRAALRLDDHALIALDFLVGICGALSNQEDARSRSERVDSFLDGFEESELRETLQYVLTTFEGVDPERWSARMTRMTGPGFKKYARRLLGAAEYHLLEEAFKADAAVVSFAFRRLVRAAMPFAVAWSDAVQVVSREQLKAVNGMLIKGQDLIDAVVQLDAFVGTKMLSALPMESTTASDDDLRDWSEADVPGLVEQFRQVVAESSIRRVEEANAPLVRKIRGARSALEGSEDGASQAANSLIELLDRIIREPYPKDTVLAWSDENFPDDEEMFHVEQGVRKPTKRAEALCFAHSGQPVDTANPQGYVLHDVLARVLVAVRNRLQKIKHADKGTAEERDQVMQLSKALESALMLVLSLARAQAAEQQSDPAEAQPV